MSLDPSAPVAFLSYAVPVPDSTETQHVLVPFVAGARESELRAMLERRIGADLDEGTLVGIGTLNPTRPPRSAVEALLDATLNGAPRAGA